MRETALRRKKQAVLVEGSFALNKLPLPAWQALHMPLPLGFAAAPVLAAAAPAAPAGSEEEGHKVGQGAGEARREGMMRQSKAMRLTRAEQVLVEEMARECAGRMLMAEPQRWEAYTVQSLVEELDLKDVALRYLDHYQRLMATQTQVPTSLTSRASLASPASISPLVLAPACLAFYNFSMVALLHVFIPCSLTSVCGRMCGGGHRCMPTRRCKCATLAAMYCSGPSRTSISCKTT